MRAAILTIDSKSKIRPIIRKKDKHKQDKTLRLQSSHVEIKNLEHLNEALRIHKTHTMSASNWILEPKDSCEVHKKRLKKHSGGKRKYKESELSEIESPDEIENKRKREVRVRPTRKSRTRRPARTRRRHKSEREYPRESDRDWCCPKCRSMSYSTASEASE